MISIEDYCANPCRSLSIPYWKNKGLAVPPKMKIVHQDDFDESYLQNYMDEPYFRLIHTMKAIPTMHSRSYGIRQATRDDLNVIVELINQSYSDLSVTFKQIHGYTETCVYDETLWVIAYDKTTGTPVGCGIADLDREIKEGVLEWIQVLPEYRMRKIGQLIVCELLHRLENKASFVTVSGKANNNSKPELLYRKCGFTGDDLWHILVEK